MAGFLDDLGNWLGDVVGWNQAQQGANLANQSDVAVGAGVGDLKAGATAAANEAKYGQGREKKLDTQTDIANKATTDALGNVRQSIGQNAAETAQKAQESATKQAGAEAIGAGQAATETALEGARTGGLNKGEAAIQAGNAAGKAATGTYAPAMAQGENLYMGGVNAQQGAANAQQAQANALASQGSEAASRGLTSTGQEISAGGTLGNIGTGLAGVSLEAQKQAAGAGGGLIGGLLGGMEKGGEAVVPEATEHPDKLGAGADKRKSLHGQNKVHAVMKEFEKGTLHSGSGGKVKDRDQAVAIAMSEAGMSKAQGGMDATVPAYIPPALGVGSAPEDTSWKPTPQPPIAISQSTPSTPSVVPSAANAGSPPSSERANPLNTLTGISQATQSNSQPSDQEKNPYQGQEEIGKGIGSLLGGGAFRGAVEKGPVNASDIMSIIGLIGSMAEKGGKATVPYSQKAKQILKVFDGMDTSTIPPGFEKDTYPIMVSSGEKVQVTPADQVPAEEKAKAKPDLKAAIAKIKRKTPQSGPVTQKDVNANAALRQNSGLADLFIELAKRAR